MGDTLITNEELEKYLTELHTTYFNEVVSYNFTPPTENSRSKVCQCGKEKHGFANHCDWCPMYEKVNI